MLTVCVFLNVIHVKKNAHPNAKTEGISELGSNLPSSYRKIFAQQKCIGMNQHQRSGTLLKILLSKKNDRCIWSYVHFVLNLVVRWWAF